MTVKATKTATKTPTKQVAATRSKKPQRKSRTVPGDGVVLYSGEEAANRLNIGRTVAYRLVSAGQIESFKVSGLRRMTSDALVRYIEHCQMVSTRRRSA